MYQPVSHVVTDGEGRVVRVDECNCDDGTDPWEPDFIDCPVHGEDQTQEALEQADILAHEAKL